MDSVYNVKSSLFDISLSNMSSWYYNTSAGSPDIDPNTGLPFGFFHYELPGFASGYPLFVDVRDPVARVKEMMR